MESQDIVNPRLFSEMSFFNLNVIDFDELNYKKIQT